MSKMSNTAPRIEELKRQLRQLEDLLKQGVLSSESSRGTRDQLEQELVALLLAQGQAGSAAAAVSKPAAKLWLGLAAFVLMLGLAGYAWRGNPEGLRTAPGEAGVSTANEAGGHADEAQINAMLERLAEKLKSKPDDAQGWAMLARSYTARGRHADALPAYKRVVELLPKDAQALADYADGLATVNKGQLTGEPEKLVMQALALDKNNVKALSLAGTLAFDRGDYKAAVAYWEPAAQAADPAGEMSQQLRSALAEARQRAGLPPAAAPQAATQPLTESQQASPADGAARVSGRVELAAALKSKVSPDDTLFIFARAPSGSRMPLAILRKKASDLPVDFVLDDSLAMSPAAKLSSAPLLLIGARISKSGDAVPRPGDLQGLSAPLALGSRDIRLEIKELVQP